MTVPDTVHGEVVIGPWSGDPHCTALVDLDGNRCGTQACRPVSLRDGQPEGDAACAGLGHLELVLAEIHGRITARRGFPARG